MPASKTCFLSARQRAARTGELQRRHIGGKTALGLQLQQARGVGFRQRRQFRVRRQNPFQRHAEDAMALAHAGGVKLVADFAADEFRRGGERIKRERGGKTLLQMQRAVRALQHHAVEPAAVQRQAEHAVSFFRFRKLIFRCCSLRCVVREQGSAAPCRPAPSRAGSSPGGKE